jgi:hypothetical protein
MAIQIGLSNSAEVYKFPHTIGATSSMISGRNRPNETSYPNVHVLRCPYNSTMTSKGLETQPGRYQIPPNAMIPNHHKRKTWLEHGHENKGSNAAKNQKLNVEDHITTTPTRPWKKTYPPCRLLIFRYLHRPPSRNYTSI